MSANNRKSLRAVDLFAGAGGAATGAVQAGLDLVWAGNHSPLAVEYHRMNHPGAQHACQDLCQANFYTLPQHEVVWASPACQGHARARGKERPHHDALRATAWAVLAAAEAGEPPFIVVENVPGFLTWKLFPAWASGLEALGYHLDAHRLFAKDFGVPQIRERLFLIATRGRGRGFSFRPPAIQDGPPILEALDLDHGPWKRISKRTNPLAERTQACIRDGRARFGKRFVVPYFGSARRALSIDSPIWSVTTRDGFGVVDGDYFRMLQRDEYRRAMAFPDGYRLPATKADAVLLLGNAVPPPVSKEICSQIQRFWESRGAA